MSVGTPCHRMQWVLGDYKAQKQVVESYRRKTSLRDLRDGISGLGGASAACESVGAFPGEVLLCVCPLCSLSWLLE